MGCVLPQVIRLLLDTHVFIWMLREPERLSVQLREMLGDPTVVRFVSAVSAFEIAQLVRLGRLADGELVLSGYSSHLRTARATELPLTTKHALLAGSFPQAHRDPFDRMLAAQSILEDLPLATVDSKMANFGVTVIW